MDHLVSELRQKLPKHVFSGVARGQLMPVPACDDTRYWLPRYDDSLGGQRRNNVIRRSLIILTPHILLMAPPQLQVHPGIGNSKQHPGRGTEVIINDDRWPQV